MSSVYHQINTSDCFSWNMEHLLVIAFVVMPGVWSRDWKVTINNQCALRGTSVVIQCSYDYPAWQSVEGFQWFEKYSDTLLPLQSDRFVFIGDKKHNCDLLIKDVEYYDAGTYYFIFKTNFDRWTSKPFYLTVKVPSLTAFVEPSTVTEGDNVKLTCHSSCSTQTNLQFVWFRDREPVSNPNFTASKEDAGSYYCALSEQRSEKSSPVSLNVQYAPKNVKMLSLSASEDVTQGSVVMFSCNSEANPPVTDSGYSLLKDGHFISLGKAHTISEVQPSDSGQYQCQASNNITWRGSILFRSSATALNVQYHPMNISIWVDTAEVTEGTDVNMTCNSNANPPVNEYTWYKRDSSDRSSMVVMGSGPVLSLFPVQASHTGHYTCQVRNRLGEDNSTELLLSVQTQDRFTSFPILAGIGVSLFAALMMALLLYWKKNMAKNIKQTTVIRQRGSTSSNNDETVNHIYANTHTFHSTSTQIDQTLHEEVTYSDVTFKTKSHPRQKQTRALQMDNSVIYATVAKPR